MSGEDFEDEEPTPTAPRESLLETADWWRARWSPYPPCREHE